MSTHEFVIEMPLDGFTPEKLDILTKMVSAKENLIKAALSTEKLPIQVKDGIIKFPWFMLEDSSHAAYYVQFIWALCNTAKVRKRVNVSKNKSSPNSKQTMRRWLTSLGMFGKEYKNARKLLLKKFK